jgi:hypothetical protein
MGLFTETPSFREKVEAAFASVIAAEKFRVSDQTPRPFVNDCRIIVLENDALRFRVVRDRGYFEVDVASQTDPHRTYDINTICRALKLDGKAGDGRSLDEFAAVVSASLETVAQALSPDRVMETQAAYDASVKDARQAFSDYAASLETSGYTARVGDETRRWRRRWNFKLGFFCAGVVSLLQGRLNETELFTWAGVALVAVAFFISGKHRTEPLPPIPGSK